VRSELAELRRQLAEVTRQEGKLLDLYLQDDLLVPQLRERLDEYGRRRAGLEERLARAGQVASSQAAERGQADALRRLCRRALRGLATLSPEGRQQLLRALVDEVRVSDTSIEIHGIIPVTLPTGGRAGRRPVRQHDRISNEPEPYLIVIPTISASGR
jgi:hypothetical protein